MKTILTKTCATYNVLIGVIQLQIWLN